MTSKTRKLAYADGLDVIRKEMVGLIPSDIQVDWTRNVSRSCLYTFRGDPCCFRIEDVEDLTLPTHILKKIKEGSADPSEAIAEHAGPISLLRQGQQFPVSVYFDGKKRPVLVAGNRRLFAFLILEEHGLLSYVPVVHGRAGQGTIEAITIDKPKDPEGWLRIAAANIAENGRKACTPVDVAWSCRRYALTMEEGGEYGLGNAKAGKMVAPLVGYALSPRSVARYIQLLSCPPSTLGKVHRGEMTMASALAEASEEGHGNARGSRTGIKHTDLRKIKPGVLAEIAARRKPNEVRLFSAREVELALLAVAGEDVRPPDWLPAIIERGKEAEAEAKAAAKDDRKRSKKAPRRSEAVA